MWRALTLAWELGYIIAIPLILWLLLGRWVDARFGTYPLATVGAIILALISTGIWMTKKMNELRDTL